MALFREADADIYHSHEPSLGGWLAMRAMPHRKHIVTNQDPRLLRDWWIEFRHPTYSPFQVLKTAAYYENPLTRRSVRAAHRVMVPALYLKKVVAGKYGLADGAYLHAHADSCSGIGEQGREADRLLPRATGPA